MTKDNADEPPDLIELGKITLIALGKKSRGTRLNGELSKVRKFVEGLERKFDPESGEIIDTELISHIRAMAETYVDQRTVPLNYRGMIGTVYKISAELRDINRMQEARAKVLLDTVTAFTSYKLSPL